METRDIGGTRYELVAAKLGYPPIDFIAKRRRTQVTRGDHSQGPPSFYRIATELSQAAGVSVTHESVRRWFYVAFPDEVPPPKTKRKAKRRKG